MKAATFDHAATLSACARGEQAAFHRLYDHEAPHMLALCHSLLPEDAEGLLHDTFALIWRNADQYDRAIGPARAWIYSVLRHVARSRRIRQNAVPPLAPPAAPSPATVRGPLARLASVDDPLAFTAVAHAYLHGADYSRLSTWLRHSETGLRQACRTRLKELEA